MTAIAHEPIDLRPEGPRLRRAMGDVTIAWVFGAVWVTAISGAPLAMFAQSLGCSRFEFGVLSALPFMASLLSLPSSVVIERTGDRRRLFFYGHYFQRVLWIAIALVPVWILGWQSPSGPNLAVASFLLLVLLMHSGQAMGGPAWVSWMADIVPGRIRGRYFSRRRQWGILSAIPTAIVVGWILDHYAGGGASTLQILRVCSWIFIVAALFGVADIAMFHLVPNVPKAPKRGAHLFRSLAGPLRNKQYLWFAGFVATLTFAVSFMGQFVTLYVLEEVKVKGMWTQLMLLVAPMVAQLLVLSAWGRAVDRMGKRPVLKLATLGFAPVAIGWCFLTQGNVWLGYALSALGAAFYTGVEIANFNFVIQMAGSSDEEGGADGGTSYVAVNTVIINIAGCLGGLASGAIAESLEDMAWKPLTAMRALNYYDVLFILSGVMRLTAVVVFLPHMHEPTAKRGRDALRFMTANVYSNLSSLASQSFGLIVRRRNHGTDVVKDAA